MDHESATLLDHRKTGFEQFKEQLKPGLATFVSSLGAGSSEEALRNADALVEPIERALADMDVATEQDRVWLLVHLTYFVGEYFAQRYGGQWYVDEMEGSPFFARYVVGRFASPALAAAMVDPSSVAQDYVEASKPRRLRRLLDAVNADLATIG